MKRIILKNFRIADESCDFFGSLVIEDGCIKEIVTGKNDPCGADIIIDGGGFAPSSVIMPAFVDLHAHFREPGFPEKETLESASLAAVSGGFCTVICMANTNPVIDTISKARALKDRSDALGLVDLYPVLSLTKNMEGMELSQIKNLGVANDGGKRLPLMLSEDGRDVPDDGLFLAAMAEAKRLGIPVSCHCDLDGENNAVRRAIELGRKTGCRIHIAHVSTKEAVETIRKAKKAPPDNSGFALSCEVTPHHIGANEEDARRMGEKSFGRVNPPLRTEADRLSLIAAAFDGTIDAIATDHAPHTETDKAAGAPGFSGLETAFAACWSNLGQNLQRISALMSANPARITGLTDRGRIAQGQRADLVIVDTQAVWKVDPAQFKSRGKCSPFAGRELQGKIIMTFNSGRIVFNGGINV
ncbi:MAG: dihydroorotase [Treponema sp.]|nr:dihydroorotase [Treponema sp.]